MRGGRPIGLAELRRDRMHQVANSVAQRRTAARATLGQARNFRRAATGNLAEGLVLPAISALHEAARLAITAVAALDGYRFSNTAGAHEAVIDYALAIQLVDRARYAQLDQLRELRHQVNYPEDMVALSVREIDQYSELVDTVLTLAAAKIPASRIPPPPR
jgi:transposase